MSRRDPTLHNSRFGPVHLSATKISVRGIYHTAELVPSSFCEGVSHMWLTESSWNKGSLGRSGRNQPWCFFKHVSETIRPFYKQSSSNLSICPVRNQCWLRYVTTMARATCHKRDQTCSRYNSLTAGSIVFKLCLWWETCQLHPSHQHEASSTIVSNQM